MKYSHHAEKRQQQRNIPPLIVDWLLNYGEREYSHGSEIVFFNKRSRRDLEKDIGRSIVNRLSDFLNSYIIVNAEKVVTVGHRYKRIKHR